MTLYIMVGLPGAGKTTWAKLNKDKLNSNYISRDEIRNMEDENQKKVYPKEKDIFNEYVNRIQKNIDENKNCIADATQIDSKARVKLISNLKLDNNKIVIVNLKINPNTCALRNEQRSGKACVPRLAILNMAKRLDYVENFYQDDNIIYSSIIDVDDKMNENIKINNNI